jgi:hypothetical protein
MSIDVDVPFGVVASAGIPVPSHAGPHWHEDLVAQAEERRREWQKTVDFHENQESERFRRRTLG